MRYVPVFTYHRLTPAGQVKSRFDFSSDDFRSHLKILKEAGLKCVTPEDIRIKDPDTLTSRAVMITFDDGYESDYHVALPMLAEFGFKAVTFITANLVNTPGYLTWEKIRELARAGFSVQSHSLNHRFLNALSFDEMLEELKKSKEIIEDKAGVKVEYVSAPGGRISAAVVRAAAEAGYKGIFNSKPGYKVRQEKDIFVFSRFVLKNSIAREEFKRLSEKNSFALLKASAVYSAKDLVRKALGIR